jgi:hypothetical protein
MAPAAEPDRGHPGSHCRLDTERAVLDDQTPVRCGREALRGIEKQIRRRFAPRHHRRAEQGFAKPCQQAGQLEFSADLFRHAARCDTNRQSQRIERLGNALATSERSNPSSIIAPTRSA